jgi:hypothetical protein
MDVSKLLRPPAGHDPSDLTSLAEENDRLRRLLAATIRACNSTRQELDAAREALGSNNSPLTFLLFPREVRDQIYLYCLQARVNVQTEPRPIAYLHFACLQWKPPTPGLCLTNKQIHREANEVMYGRNVFHFSSPGEMLRFEDQIGWNRELVQRIEIMTTDFPSEAMMDPELVAPCDYAAVPSHWIKAFSVSKLNGIVEMVVAGEDNGDGFGDEEGIEMPDGLRRAIEGVFARNRRENLTPRLVLKGFAVGEREKFPRSWKVKIAAGYSEPTKLLNNE